MAKRKSSRSRPSNRYIARDILAIFETESRPLTWREIAHLAKAEDPRSITQLRQMLKGLIRNDELARDQTGAYHLVGASESRVVQVELQGRQLFAGELPIEDPQRFSLRAGDQVKVRDVQGQARVTEVVSLSDALVTGVLRKQGRYPYVDALGAFRGQVTLAEPPMQANDGDSVHVRILDRDRRGLVGVVVDVVEHANVLDQAINTAVEAGDIPNEWPKAVLEASERLPKSVAAGRHPSRQDLTGMALVTIDGETAKDFDDAVYAEPIKGRGGGFRLVVAIADVAHYVKRGTPLDDEAVLRGTSVYFPQRVIPMLPEAISNGLCSLRPKEARLTLVCDMRIDRNGQVKSYQFSEAVIYSHARLTYEQVQAHLDDETPLPVDPQYAAAVNKSVATLATLYAAMRKAREKRGALDFASREANMQLAKGRVVALHPVHRLMAHQIIEEAMIAANVCAASFLEAQSKPGMYRVHEPPDPDKMDELRQALGYLGVRVAPGEVAPGALQAALEKLPEHVDQWIYAQLALRTLKQAVYTPKNEGHYGLALERYMHFTSPIRRYPDLLVHRAIKAVLAKQRGRKPKAVPNMDELHALGERCSTYERRAESASWLVEGWLKCDYLQDRVGERFEGLIAGVTEFGVFVELTGYFVQGLLHISNLGSDYYHFEPRVMALVGERSGRRFALGDPISVVIREVDPPQSRIDLLLYEGGSRKSLETKQDNAEGKKKTNKKTKKDGVKQRKSRRRRR